MSEVTDISPGSPDCSLGPYLITRVPQKTYGLALGCLSLSLLAAKPRNALSCLENWPWPEAQATQGTTLLSKLSRARTALQPFFSCAQQAVPCTPPASSEKGAEAQRAVGPAWRRQQPGPTPSQLTSAATPALIPTCSPSPCTRLLQPWPDLFQ